MDRNIILKRIRYIFDFGDSKMMEIFALGGADVSRERLCNFLKSENHEEFEVCTEDELGMFLNGLITKNRGPRDEPDGKPRLLVNNNTILMKLKIALNLKAEEIIEILDLADFRFGKSELSAFFRNPTHRHYRECKDQILRNFLHGLQIKHRGEITPEEGEIDPE